MAIGNIPIKKTNTNPTFAPKSIRAFEMGPPRVPKKVAISPTNGFKKNKKENACSKKIIERKPKAICFKLGNLIGKLLVF